MSGPGSSVGIATELPGWKFWNRIPVGTRFSALPERLWGSPSLLYNEDQVLPGGKVRPGCAADHSLRSSAEGPRKSRAIFLLTLRAGVAYKKG